MLTSSARYGGVVKNVTFRIQETWFLDVALNVFALWLTQYITLMTFSVLSVSLIEQSIVVLENPVST